MKEKEWEDTEGRIKELLANEAHLTERECEAFTSMARQLKRHKPLSAAQRDWVQRVHERLGLDRAYYASQTLVGPYGEPITFGWDRRKGPPKPPPRSFK